MTEHRVKNTVNCTIIWEYETGNGRKITLTFPPHGEMVLDSFLSRRLVSDCPMIEDRTVIENDPSYLDRQLEKMKVRVQKLKESIKEKLPINCEAVKKGRWQKFLEYFQIL